MRSSSASLVVASLVLALVAPVGCGDGSDDPDGGGPGAIDASLPDAARDVSVEVGRDGTMDFAVDAGGGRDADLGEGDAGPVDAPGDGDGPSVTDGDGPSMSDGDGLSSDVLPTDAPPDPVSGEPAELCGCGAGQKVCSTGSSSFPPSARLRCVSFDDPAFGCGPTTCDTCARPHATARCEAGACKLECLPGWADCNGGGVDGCETDLSSPTSCAACGVVCDPGQACAPSGCVPSCQVPLTTCNGRCVNLASAHDYCGSCAEPPGAACPRQYVCVGGKCESPSCPSGGSFCAIADGCVDLITDPEHCGTCDKNCAEPNANVLCNSGTCVVTGCKPGFSRCGDACVSLSADPGNCGTCGHACGTGACVGGTCIPVESALVAGGLGKAEALAVDQGAVFWTDAANGTVMKVAKSGGTPIMLADGQAAPSSIAVDACHVYWANPLGAAVMRVRKSGGMPELVSQADEPKNLVLDDGNVYWLETGGKIQKAPKAGGAKTLAVATPASQFALDGTDVYSVHGVGGHNVYIFRTPKDGGAEAYVGTVLGLSIRAKVDEHFVFAALQDISGSTSVRLFPKPASPSSDSGAIVPATSVADFATDLTHLYWLDGAAVKAFPKCGGEPFVLAPQAAASATAMAIDDRVIYLLTPKAITRIGAPGAPRASVPAACPSGP
jgi:hypothetical protein